MTEEVREKFRQLKLCGERNIKNHTDKELSDIAVIDYINDILDSGEDYGTEDICFAYWNISDCYALLRKSEELYKNHKKFFDFVSCSECKYKFYPVCDATQRFTLALGGYGEFWHEIYRDAVGKATVTDENYRIAYEAHRAAMSVHKQLDIPDAHLHYSREKFAKFLDSCKEREEYFFFKLIYDSLCMRAYMFTDIDIEQSCTMFYDHLHMSDDKTPYVIGEWEYLNRRRSLRNRAVVGVTAAVNALIDTGEIKRASELYNDAKLHGLPDNAYVNNRLDIAI